MRYVELEKTGTHVISPINSEFTLCGDAIVDRLPEDEEHHGKIIKQSTTGRVTCPQCLRVVRYCRGKDK